MKKLFTLLCLLLAVSCAKEYDFEVHPYNIVMPANLEIDKEVGIKLESNFTRETALMNVKINTAGIFTLKVVDIKNNVIAKELVTGKSGDNLFKVYVNTLPRNSYRIELFCDDQKVGAVVINLLEL